MLFALWPDDRELRVVSFLLRLSMTKGANGTTDQIGGLLQANHSRASLRRIRDRMVRKLLLAEHPDQDVWRLSAWGHTWAVTPPSKPKPRHRSKARLP